MIQKLTDVQCPQWYFQFFCIPLPPPPTSSERICSYILLQAHVSLFTAGANRVPQTRLLHLTFRVHESNSTVWPTQSAIHGQISNEVTQTANQPYDYSILNSFQIKSSVIIHWWLEREKPFVSEQIYFSLKLRPSDFHFTSLAAAEIKLLKAQMTCSNVLSELNQTS